MCEGQGHRPKVQGHYGKTCNFQGFYAVYLTWDLEVKVKGHKGQGQIRVPNKGRWAHITLPFLPITDFFALLITIKCI